jgi:hypothetical protein
MEKRGGELHQSWVMYNKHSQHDAAKANLFCFFQRGLCSNLAGYAAGSLYIEFRNPI